MIRQVEIIAERIAQPVADWVHDRFGMTCYRLAVQLSLTDVFLEVVHYLVIRQYPDWNLALQIVVFVWIASKFNSMDAAARRAGYRVKPAESIVAGANALAWGVIALFSLVLVPIPPFQWSDFFGPAECALIAYGYLLAMCHVRPRLRRPATVPAGNLRTQSY